LQKKGPIQDLKILVPDKEIYPDHDQIVEIKDPGFYLHKQRTLKDHYSRHYDHRKHYQRLLTLLSD
jgi:hypothetical protein